MSKKILTDIDFDSVSRVRNSLDPLLPQDLVTLAFLNAYTAGTLYSQEAQDLIATSTTSQITYLNKLTLVTPNLGLGNYELKWAFKFTSGQNKDIDILVSKNAVNIFTSLTIYGNAQANDAPFYTCFKRFPNLSGVNTFTLDFRAASNSMTATVSEAFMVLQRLS